MPARRKRSSAGSKRAWRSSSGGKRWTLNYEEVVPKVAVAVIERLGLDYANIDINFIYDIVEEIVRGIAESRATKPSIKSLINNIIRNKLLFMKAVATKLIDKDELSVNQLEFIIAYTPEIAGRAAPKLYKAAKKAGADHIIESLRSLWLKYGRPTPFTCPRCGFRALTPDLVCMVCEAEIDEIEFKENIRFKELLREFVEESPASASMALSAGFVLYDGEKLYAPSARPMLEGKLVMTLYLTTKEKEIIYNLIENKIKG